MEFPNSLRMCVMNHVFLTRPGLTNVPTDHVTDVSGELHVLHHVIGHHQQLTPGDHVTGQCTRGQLSARVSTIAHVFKYINVYSFTQNTCYCVKWQNVNLIEKKKTCFSEFNEL